MVNCKNNDDQKYLSIKITDSTFIVKMPTLTISCNVVKINKKLNITQSKKLGSAKS